MSWHLKLREPPKRRLLRQWCDNQLLGASRSTSIMKEFPHQHITRLARLWTLRL